MAAVRKHGSIFFRCLALKHVSMSNRICCSRKKSVRRLMSHFYHNNNKNGGRSHICSYFNKLAAWSLSQNVTVKKMVKSSKTLWCWNKMTVAGKATLHEGTAITNRIKYQGHWTTSWQQMLLIFSLLSEDKMADSLDTWHQMLLLFPLLSKDKMADSLDRWHQMLLPFQLTRIGIVATRMYSVV